MSASPVRSPSLLELVRDEALADRVVELVCLFQLSVRTVADEPVDALLVIADRVYDLHQPLVHAGAVVGDRLALLRPRGCWT